MNDDGAAAAGVASGPRPDFIPSASWKGAREGYYFGTSDRGTGYYKDGKAPSVDGGAGAVADGHSAQQPAKKKAKRTVQIAEDRNVVQTIPSRFELLEEAERQADAGGQRVLELTPAGVRDATSALAKAVARNEIRRAEAGPDHPERFLESEVALFEHVVALKAVAASPRDLYPIVLDDESALLPTLVQLLLHENSDIVSSVVSVLLEWLDPALLVAGEDEDEAEGGGTLVAPVAQLAAAVIRDAADLLVGNLARIQNNEDDDNDPSKGKDEDDDDDDDEVGKGTEDVLSLIENLLEMDLVIEEEGGGDEEEDGRDASGGQEASAATKLCRDTPLVSWLFQQVESGSNGKFADRSLELLALLAPREDVYAVLPDWSKIPVYKSNLIEDDDDDDSPSESKPKANGSDTKKRRRSLDGIEILLQMVAAYRKKQPSDDQQLESLENACMILASALTYSPACNVQAFLDAQGIELAVRCLKERVHAGGVALRWLDFAGSDPVYRKACEHVVDAGTLKYLLPLFMGRSLPKLAAPSLALVGADSSSSISKKLKKEWTQEIEATTIQIMYALTRHLTDDSPNDAKQRLLAKFLDHDKCDRLVELCLSYDQKARTAEYKFFRSDVEDALRDDEAVQFAALEAKLSGGGDLFHRLAAIAAFCCVGSKRCHERILSQLRLQQSGIGLVRDALEEFVSYLDDGVQKEQLQGYLEQI